MDTLKEDIPEPLDAYCQQLDSTFSRPTQRDNLRTYLRGLLLGVERNKTTTGLALTEPGRHGSKHKAAQRLQWFLTESSWNPDDLHHARLAIMRSLRATKPDAHAILVINETSDRKFGAHTAHVGRQYLNSIGKVDSGVVSVHVLYAREHAYFPLLLRPFTPASHFERKTSDPAYRTKPQLAIEMIEAVKADWPFRAVVVEDSYGQSDVFQHHLTLHRIPFVMPVGASYTWWHPDGQQGSAEELARNAEPDAWQPLRHASAGANQAARWVAEVESVPFGPTTGLRLVVVTTDPVQLPATTTDYLISNLRWGDEDHASSHVPSPPATPHEIALLDARRAVIEEAYQDVRQHLGWAHYQVRSDVAMRRHWALVCAAFCFLWWYAARQDGQAPRQERETEAPTPAWRSCLREIQGRLEPMMRRAQRFTLEALGFLCDHLHEPRSRNTPRLR